MEKTDEEMQTASKVNESVEKRDGHLCRVFMSSPLQQIDADLQEIVDFRENCLIVHNKYRAKHAVSPLELDKSLCNLAQELVDNMANTGLVQQFKNIDYGVNIFVASGTMYNADYIIKSWYNEIDNYVYTKPGLTHQTRHFTQIIWKNTKFLGVGIRKKNGHTWTMCIYNPPGNIVGEFSYNVLLPTINNVRNSADDSNQIDEPLNLQTIYDKFIKDCLDIHNKYRLRHGCPPLCLNNAMNQYSKEWALELSKYGSLRHRPNNRYGENLFLAANYQPTAEEVVKEWYDEIELYDYQRPCFTKETGNFTQIIWKETTDLGVGIIKVGKSTYIVCNYAPHGNILERFKENVLPLINNNIDDSTDMLETFSSSEDKVCTNLTINELNPSKHSLKDHKTFEEQCLNSHNKYRALHGCPPLMLNKIMSAYAQEWSEYLATNKTLEHRPNNPYGENLFYATFHITGNDPVQKWYQEIKDYDFKQPGFHPSTGHFTQVIWKKTKHLGVGITIFNKITFVVCNYEPWGNVINQFDKNVPPLLRDSCDSFINITKSKQKVAKHLRNVQIRCAKIKQNNPQKKHLQNISQSQNKQPSNNENFEELCLQTHNKYRALHGCPPLKIAKYLNVFAMEWAKHLSKTKKFEHRPNNRYGENLYFGSGFHINGADPVITWYNEIHDFNFLKPDFQANTGHFTQLIWKDSKELGVAVINLGENTYVVCNYMPPGNIMGTFEANVPMALEGPFSKTELQKRNFSSQFDGQAFAQEILKLHNSYRAKHHAPSLKLNEDLNKYATEWAKHLAETNTLEHRKPPKYGENVFKASGWTITPDELMRMWYNEWKIYNFNKNEFVPAAGHFTQLVWKNTKVIGVGTAKQGRSMWIVVNYDPPGNFIGGFKDNVFPGK